MNGKDIKDLARALGRIKTHTDTYSTISFRNGADRVIEELTAYLASLPSFDVTQFQIGTLEAQGYEIKKVPDRNKKIYVARNQKTGACQLICNIESR